MNEVLLTSSQLPSGVAWLVNFFIEIGVLMYQGDNPKHTWEIMPNGKYKLKKSENHLKQWLPTLNTKENYIFNKEIEIQWSHDLPKTDRDERRVILLTRDGRDAAYSLFKRENAFKELWQMLVSKCNPLWLTPPETWAMFNFLWIRKIPPENLFIIKFEDLKLDPLPPIRKMMKFLGITRDESLILKAIESSSFEKAKQFENSYLRDKLSIMAMNRSGSVGEWRKNYSKKDLETFSGFSKKILQFLNYDDEQITIDDLNRYFETTPHLKIALQKFLEEKNSNNLLIKILSQIKNKIFSIGNKTLVNPKPDEERILNSIFTKRIVFKDNPNGFYVEIGASHPINDSSTYSLYTRDWTGINILTRDHTLRIFKDMKPIDVNLQTNPEKIEETINSFGPKWRQLDYLSFRGDDGINFLKHDNWISSFPKIVSVKYSDISTGSKIKSEIVLFLAIRKFKLIASTDKELFFRRTN